MIFFDRRYFRYFDWITFFLSLLISSLGLLFVFSATYRPDAMYSVFFKKQLLGMCTGYILYFICCAIDYRTLMRWGYAAYFITMGLLIFTLFKGSIGMGGQRWINLGIIKFQPSEFSKLFLPAFITYYLKLQDKLKYVFKDFTPILAIIAVSFLLIRKQPDLGTALILLFSGTAMLWFSGISKKFFIIVLSIVIIGSPFLWKCLKPYQKQRISVLLGEGDARKERYQIEQSKIAIGSGCILGKGFLKGTQNKLLFLPESRTDFIFSVLCEEMGFLGALFVLMLYMLLFMRFITVISTIKDFSSQLLAFGMVIHIMFSVCVNICMVIGLLPIVGIPLPLMSYGVTNLWLTYASLGWFNSIAMRRFHIV